MTHFLCSESGDVQISILDKNSIEYNHIVAQPIKHPARSYRVRT